ncbi:sugar transporter family protein [Stylonychia lemnae]|uniref:Hexose transporter 1 n=1 Tax=Stylonychia lemnae TaxID=5949 RepID=A0A078A7C3_STYLE|nr:sugar transporter family protein [Stylonychia lemnae]|eukprot:CDW77776.1 sugar transporter family protein [Stylonychia lemnae]
MSQELDTKLNPSIDKYPTSSPSIVQPGGVRTGFLYAFILTIGIGSFQFGYSIGVFNTLQNDFAYLFEWDKDKQNLWSSVITSICSVGSAVGSIGVGVFVKYGKKNCILFANILVIIGAGITTYKNVYAIVAGRFIYGLATGSFSVLVPINEAAPTELKGPLGAVTQILITVGIMIAFFLGIPIPKFDYVTIGDVSKYVIAGGAKASFVSDNYWRVMFALPIAFSIIQIILLLTVFNYETPKFLKQNNQHGQLSKLMGKIYEPDRIVERINAIVIESGKATTPSYGQTLCHPKYQYATILGCALSVLQQLSGINAVMFYSSKIFDKMGIDTNLGSGLVGFINMASTFGALFLLGKFGRKQLLWSMSFLMAADLVGLGIAFFYLENNSTAQVFCTIFIMLFVVLFEFSLGPIPWLYMAEIMTEKGLSIAILLNWLMTILMAIVTPFVISGELFIVFGGLCGVTAFFSMFLLKETKGLTEAEVAELYSREKNKYSHLKDTTA